MDITIRPARPTDVPTLAEFNCRMAWETEELALDLNVVGAGVAAVLADPGKGFYLIGEHRGQTAGQLLITPEWSDWRNGWLWWIQSVYVRENARRQGVFAALYHEVMKRARAATDIVGVRLYVERANMHAQDAYRRLGMVETAYRLYESVLK